MASINVHRAKDGTRSYRVRVRIKGQPIQTASFSTLRDARKWAKLREAEMLAGKYRIPQKHTLAELIAQYQDDIQPRKTPHNQRRQWYILRYWGKTLGHCLLSEIQPSDIIQWRNALSKTRAPGTVCLYLAVLSHMFTVAMKEYQWAESNPVRLVSRPPLPQGRVRFLTDNERSRLLSACQESKNQHLYALVLTALSTGMRQGELLGLRYRDIDLDQGTIYLEKTKNKRRRAVPLVGKALETIREMRLGQEYVFPAVNRRYPFNSYRKAWKYAVRNAELRESFRFHDLRHAAASAMVQLGVPLYTVGTILGHTNPGTMTARYAHLATDNLRDALEIMTNHLFPGRA